MPVGLLARSLPVDLGRVSTGCFEHVPVCTPCRLERRAYIAVRLLAGVSLALPPGRLPSLDTHTFQFEVHFLAGSM